MTVISVSLTHELLERLDEFVDKFGYSSRSEAMRIAIRDSLSQLSLNTRLRGLILSTITVISETGESKSHLGLLDLRNGFDDIIFGNMHLHTEEGYCLEIFLVKGDAEEVMNFVSKAKAIRGVQEVNYTVTPISG
jgi:CopG family nickel-responsive transcriptional regulator